MIKAVIFAAGRGTRLRPLTFTRPKPSLRLLDKTIIENTIEQLQGLVEEIIIVIGYKGEMLKIGDSYKGITIRYVEQKEQLGTGDAALTALPFLGEEFIIFNGDDLYCREDIEKMLQKNPSILVKEVDNPEGYGQVVIDGEKVKEVVEKPPVAVSNLVNVGCYFLNKDFFQKSIDKSTRGEYEIVDYINNYEGDIYFQKTEEWYAISYPWNMLEATKKLFEKEEERREGEVEDGVQIKGKVILEEGSIIKSGSYIEGPVYVGKNSVIGPSAYLRENTVIHDNCRIGCSVEIKESIIASNTSIPHLSYIGDSVLGESCAIAAGTVIANLRFDGEEVKQTGRRKMGAVLGDGVKTGINCSIMPGAMIDNGVIINPHTVAKDHVHRS